MAVYDNDIHRVRTLLQQGANLSHPLYWREEWFNREYGSWTCRSPPLHTASEKGHLEIVKLLLQAGAGVDVGDGKDNSTPLHLACEEGHKEVAVYMIREAGCKVGEFCNGVCTIISLWWLQTVFCFLVSLFSFLGDRILVEQLKLMYTRRLGHTIKIIKRNVPYILYTACNDCVNKARIYHNTDSVNLILNT